MNSKSLLNINVVNGVLNISIGIDALKTSIESGELDVSAGGDFVINDLELFVVDFTHELRSESEIGTTVVHKMFDMAALKSLENGGAGCDVLSDESK